MGALNGKSDADGFIITYGDGKLEKRPFNFKFKLLDPETLVQWQLQLTTILEEIKGRGYHIVGSMDVTTAPIILEKD